MPETVLKKFAVYRNHNQQARTLMYLVDTQEKAEELAQGLAQEEPDNLNAYGPSYPYYYEVVPVWAPKEQDRNRLY